MQILYQKQQKNLLEYKMKKILFVFGGEKASGAEFVIERLIRHNTGHQNILLMASGTYADKLKSENLPYKLIINKNLKKLYMEEAHKFKLIYKFIGNLVHINLFVIKYIQQNKINIVHCNTIVPSIYLLPTLFCMRVFKPRIIWLWSDHDLEYAGSPFMMKIAPYLVQFYNKTLVVSNAVKEKYNLSIRNKILILYNGLDLSEIKIDENQKISFRQTYTIPLNSNVFGIMGQIVPRKGVLELIRLFSEGFGNKDNCYLIVAGSPLSKSDPYFEVCQKIASQYNNIFLIGYLNNVSTFYNGIDFLVNNSSLNGSEPLGTTVLEGMAYKKIVMVSDVGGSKEMVTNKISGIVYNPDSPESLKNAMDQAIVLEDHKKLEMVKNARNKIERQFEIKIMKKNYDSIISSLTY